jgi:serine/threonine-protein kinase
MAMAARRVARSVLLGALAIGVFAAAGCSTGGAPSRAASSISLTAPGKSRSASFVMPDVRGMFWSDAARQLQAWGWSGTILKRVDVHGSGYAPGMIVTQDPAPGERVATREMITLQFADHRGG